MLVKMNGNEPSGFVAVQGTIADPSGVDIHIHYRCDEPDDLAAHLPPPRSGVNLECWNLRPRSLPQDWTEPQEGLIFHLALARLREGGIQPEGTFLVANWFLADDSGIVLVDYFLPGSQQPGLPSLPEAWEKSAALANPRILSYLRHVEAWTRSWTHLLESGANNDLQAADVIQVNGPSPE